MRFLAIIFAVPPGLAIAQGYIPPLEQCEGLYSVQKRNCSVEHVYRCETERGTLIRKDRWQPDRPRWVATSDPEGNTVSTWGAANGFQIEGILENSDPISSSRLRDTGTDQFDQVIALRNPMFKDPLPSRFVGKIVLNGAELELDGVKFLVADVAFTVQVNALTSTTRGTAYLDAEQLVAITGAYAREQLGQVSESGGALAQVIHPGEPGYLVDQGRFDCGALSDAGPHLFETERAS